MNELETLVRDTLRAKADTVTDTRAGNELIGRPPARRWLPAVAAAVVVVAVGAGTAVWRLNDPGGRQAGTPARSEVATVGTCPATLPAAWRTAMTGRPVPAPGGGLAVPAAMSPDARTIVTWTHAGRSWTGVIAAGGRTVRPLYEVPADRDVASIDVDASTLVLGEIDHARASYGGPITAVVTVDLHTGRATTILRPGPGRTLAGTTSTAVFIQDGVVYWSLVRTGSRSGTVQAHDLRTGTTRVVGHTAGQDPVLNRDVRGVTWDGGEVANPHGSPAAAAAAEEVVSDGGSVAWQPDARIVRGVVHNGQRVRWADGRTVRTFTVRGLTDPDIDLVSGPFVLLAAPNPRPLADGEPATLQLLDVRTGALAPIVVPSGAQLAAAGFWTFTTRTGVLLVNTRTLPGLHC